MAPMFYNRSPTQSYMSLYMRLGKLSFNILINIVSCVLMSCFYIKKMMRARMFIHIYIYSDRL